MSSHTNIIYIFLIQEYFYFILFIIHDYYNVYKNIYSILTAGADEKDNTTKSSKTMGTSNAASQKKIELSTSDLPENTSSAVEDKIEEISHEINGISLEYANQPNVIK